MNKSYYIHSLRREGNLSEYEAASLFEKFEPYMLKIDRNESGNEYYLIKDILYANENGMTPENWLKECELLDEMIQNPPAKSQMKRLVDLLDDFDVSYEIHKGMPSQYIKVSLRVDNQAVFGYGGFKSEYIFNKEGNFVELNIFE